ncbi:MAG: hypothetical protein ABI847_15025, partial [Anaerolineales bacterium]
MVLPALAPDPFETLILAERRDVRLVLIQGRPIVAEAALRSAFEAMQIAARPVRLDGRESWLTEAVARPLARSACQEPGLDLPEREAA